MNRKNIKESQEINLEKFYSKLDVCANCMLEVIGYADTQRNQQVNLKLSYDREEAIYNWLLKEGFPKEWVIFYGKSNFDKLVDKLDDQHQIYNRRVEVKLLRN